MRRLHRRREHLRRRFRCCRRDQREWIANDDGHNFGLWTLEWVFRGNVGIHRAHKAIQLEGDDCRPRRSSRLKFPWLTPIRNSFELRGLHRRPYFGPRTCGGGKTIFHRSVWGSQSGLSLLTPIMETYDGPAWRLIAISWSAPFQGFARLSGIQVFRLYSTPSPATESQMRSLRILGTLLDFGVLSSQ